MEGVRLIKRALNYQWYYYQNFGGKIWEVNVASKNTHISMAILLIEDKDISKEEIELLWSFFDISRELPIFSYKELYMSLLV